jgi:hypothetical protein
VQKHIYFERKILETLGFIPFNAIDICIVLLRKIGIKILAHWVGTCALVCMFNESIIK